MAELCIRMVDKVSPDHPLRPTKTGRGDVIDVMPDGYDWGGSGKNPVYQIVRIPGVPVEAFVDLLEPVTDKEGRFIARRIRALDLNSIPHILQKMQSREILQLEGSDRLDFLEARKNKGPVTIVVGDGDR